MTCPHLGEPVGPRIKVQCQERGFRTQPYRCDKFKRCIVNFAGDLKPHEAALYTLCRRCPLNPKLSQSVQAQPR